MNYSKQLEALVLQTASEPEVIRQTVAKQILKQAIEALNAADYGHCARLGALGKRCRTPLKDLDFIRALAFLHLNDMASARESLKEELRYFPENTQAKGLLEKIRAAHPFPDLPPDAPEEFAALYTKIAPYSMVGAPRIFNLYTHANRVCAAGPQGCFVECGVAGGGTSGLLASVIKNAGSTRKLFCCDSFSGMPPATEHDRHGAVDAEASGWGSGTCAAPETSLISLCESLHAVDVIHIVKGFFEETLSSAKKEMGDIAFLHMDGDWYSSTKAILDNLYDQLVPGAFVQIDDYGYWEGCRKAVDEFFAALGVAPTLTKIDATGVFFFKS